MRIVPTHDPEVMRIDDDSIALRIIGFFVIVMGIAIWPILVQAESKPGEGLSGWSLAFALGCSFLSASLGLMMMLHAVQTIIDRRLEKVVHSHRLLWWRSTSEGNLQDFRRVAIVRFGRVWGVELQHEPVDRARSIYCGSGLSRSDAMKFAERVAMFSGLNVE